MPSIFIKIGAPEIVSSIFYLIIFPIPSLFRHSPKLKLTRLSYNCAHPRWTNETLTIEYFRIVLKKDLGENFLGENFFGLKTFGMTGVTGVTGVMGVAGVRLTRGRYPPSYLECLSHQDSVSIAHCSCFSYSLGVFVFVIVFVTVFVFVFVFSAVFGELT